jgi:hypothetical protein
MPLRPITARPMAPRPGTMPAHRGRLTLWQAMVATDWLEPARGRQRRAMDANLTVVATLSQNDGRILCGRPECAYCLAQVLCPAGPHGARGRGSEHRRHHRSPPGQHASAPRRHPSCQVVLTPGWVEDAPEGLWSITPRAAKRLRRDRWLTSGHPGLDPTQAEAARRRLHLGRTIVGRRAATGGLPAPGATTGDRWCHVTLPIRARCPLCGAVNLLPSSLLTDATPDLCS